MRFAHGWEPPKATAPSSAWELNAKTTQVLYQIGAIILRRARFKEIAPDRYPDGTFGLAEKLDKLQYSAPLLTEL